MKFLRATITLISLFSLILINSGFTQTNESNNNKLISMSFKDADLDYVLDFFSKATGYTIIKDADIKGRVTILSEKDIPVDQALSVLNSILTIKKYSAIANGKVLRIIPLETAKKENTEIKVGADPEKINSDDTIVTQIMPLYSANAANIVKELKDLIPEYGVLLAHTQSNSLIITATSANIKRFAQIVKELDIPLSEMFSVEVFAIKYRDATNLATALKELFKAESTSATQAEQERAARIQMLRGRFPGPPDMEQQESTPSTSSELLQLRSNVKIVADKDTNSLIVSASKNNMEIIRNLIQKLDTPTTDQAETRVFTLEYADATEIAEALNQLFRSTTSRTLSQFESNLRRGFMPGQFQQPMQQTGTATNEGSILGLPEINVVADNRTNSVIVTTTTQQMQNIASLVKQLDKDISEYEETTIVVQLENAEAENLAQVLNELFQTTAFERRRGTTMVSTRGGVMGTAAETIQSARGLTGNIKIVAERTTNSLIITSYKRNIDILKKIIKELDVILPQVLIEVKIIEVSLDNNSKFGIEWMWEHSTKLNGKSYDQSAETNFGLTDEIYGLKYAIVGKTVESLLMALEKKTDVNILSTPKILTLDNHEAVINISQEVPYLESTRETTTGGIVTSYNYKDVGVILTVTPRINKSGTVSLDVNQQINNLIEFTLFNAPVIAKREASASVTVKDGQTMIIGGIIEDKKTETNNKVPILSSLPFIGRLFQRKEANSGKTELMVFITPHIISNPEDVDISKLSNTPKFNS
ncbi:MAG: secretin N-terminal domain-containing protein [bacterium]